MRPSLILTVPLMVASSFAATEEPLRLFESMDHWERHGGTDKAFALEDGTLVLRRSGQEPSALLTKRDFENFALAFEFQCARWCESFLLLHAPRNGAYRAGLEISLADRHGHAPGPYEAGAVFRRVAPRTVAVKPSGEWNTCEVLMDWPRLAVHINGHVVQDLDLSARGDLRYTLRKGAVGYLQNFGWGMKVREFSLVPLPAKEHAVALFNGTDLTGWEIAKGNAEWTVREGVIVASDGDGYLKHECVCEDFDLRMYVRTSPAANGGVFFRWIANEGVERGHEIQILDLPGAVMPTGSIYGVARGNDLSLTPGAWELLQIFVRGSSATTYLNGVPSAHTDALTRIRPGHIVLQMHSGKGQIEFKEMSCELRVVSYE